MNITLHPVKRPVINGKEYLITDFGAVGDGVLNNRLIIQKTIDSAFNSGGGRIIIPKGIFLSGSLVLKSGIEIYLEEGAVLLGSIDRSDYIKKSRWYALILAEDGENIAIRGKGTIDGRGQELAVNINEQYHQGQFRDQKEFIYSERRNRPGEEERPQILEMVNCSCIEVSGIQIKNSACWVQSYVLCSHLFLDNLSIDSDSFWNNDGIDLDDCRDVQVSNCDINAADDGVCLKSYRDQGNERISIFNCRIRCSASAVKFGTHSFGGFRNVVIRNISVYDTYRSAIALECVDGGVLENVDISDIYARNTGNAVFIRLGHRNKEKEPGVCRNIHIRNVKAHIAFGRSDINYNQRGPGLWFFHNPIPASITGIPGHKVENVVLEDIEIMYPGRAGKGMAYISLDRISSVPEMEDGYPEYTMFQELPSWGFYTRHVKGMEMKNIVLRLEESDFRPAMIFDDVSEMKLKNINLPRNTQEQQIVKKDCSDLPLI